MTRINIVISLFAFAAFPVNAAPEKPAGGKPPAPGMPYGHPPPGMPPPGGHGMGPPGMMGPPPGGGPPEIPVPERGWRHRGLYEVELVRSWENNGIPYPPPPDKTPPRLRARSSLSLQAVGALSRRVSLRLNDRLNWTASEGDGPAAANVVNDLRELYLSIRVGEKQTLDLGRVNHGEGGAADFNPNDYFKAGALRTIVDEDSRRKREDRLGTLMARWKIEDPWGKLTLAFAPAVSTTPDKWWTGEGDAGLGLDLTNARERFHVKLVPGHWKNAPEFLLHRSNGRTHFGMNVSKNTGRKWTAYSEWSVARGGGAAGVLGTATPAALAMDPRKPRVQGAMGLSWNDARGKSLSFEYRVNQAGLSQEAWDGFLAAGVLPGPPPGNNMPPVIPPPAGPPGGPPPGGPPPGGPPPGGPPPREAAAPPPPPPEFLAGIRYRQAGASLQEPFSRNSVFIRFNWRGALRPNVNLGVISEFNPDDASGRVETKVHVRLSRKREAKFAVMKFVGGKHTEYGLIPERGLIRASHAWRF